MGLSPGTSVTGFPPGVLIGTQYVANATAVQAQNDLTTAYNNAAGQGCTQNLTGQDLGGKTLLPGVYCFDNSAQLTGTLTLNTQNNPDSIFIFRIGSTLTTASGSSVSFTNDAQTCNVFWQVGSSATLGDHTTFRGNILALTSITLVTGTSVDGRVLARNGAVTLDTNNITATCRAAPATLHVIKHVVNNNGGSTATASLFRLHIKNSLGDDVSGSPADGAENPGTSYTLAAGAYVVSEDANASYEKSFGDDCAPNGNVVLASGNVKTCTITNDDLLPTSGGGGPYFSPPVVPPLIDVVKVPSPLALPDGPGAVTYTYTLRNIGTVAVSNITMVGDTCSPIILASGDTDADLKLGVSETWIYRCSTTLSETHTNTVVTTGLANGLTATDIASATVVVGVPLVPPLIHVTKVPSPFIMLVGGGKVTYTYTVTNPGTAPLSNVNIIDDKCIGLPGRVVGHPGDLNKNNLLESNESWSFTCQTNITQTTVNTATASGEANGMTARDFAIATVIVAGASPATVVPTASPKLPNTGIAPAGESISWNIVIFSIIFILVSISLVIVLKKRAI